LNRNSLEIMFDILHLARTPKKKTHIMYSANLCYSSINKYLQILFDNGMIEKCSDTYLDTGKGLLFLKLFEQLIVLVNSTGGDNT